MEERNDAKMLTELAPLAFGFADKTFKFVSWAIILAAVTLAAESANSFYLSALRNFCGVVFVVALLLAAYELPVRDMSKSTLPKGILFSVRALQVIVGLALLLVLFNPTLPLDAVLADLVNAARTNQDS